MASGGLFPRDTEKEIGTVTIDKSQPETRLFRAILSDSDRRM
jgi:hypothetical protein